MTIIISDDASADLEDIGDFIAEDNPDAAVAFVQRLRKRCFNLLPFPNAGRKRSEIRPDLRSVTEGEYIIFYRILGEEEVVIMRIVHAKRDLGSVSFLD